MLFGTNKLSEFDRLTAANSLISSVEQSAQSVQWWQLPDTRKRQRGRTMSQQPFPEVCSVSSGLPSARKFHGTKLRYHVKMKSRKKKQ